MLRGKMYYLYQKMIIFWLQNITVMVQISKSRFVRAVDDATWNEESERDDCKLYLRELLYSLHKWIIILIWISKMIILSSIKPPTTARAGSKRLICHLYVWYTKLMLLSTAYIWWKIIENYLFTKISKNECPSRTYMILLCSF